ncbi:tRNA 4-thiouridine(8) synthase ThiI [Dehalobacterium formicoaceticum]|uniref:Probable tRNA sulfurtransferase n=1 Tax=Dehalobacterium formicoaceticum TaxID=51515 RepID=A0ABT1Y3L2_9FIRM|nr:tRNA uracil 4-sulfurtransferase ThiI [Dehalobacterium formicoaceticum]MCR6545153.1 tRNA 4-thiouridine(8) synthase ThiI [Dehalobacterium formicoaceticum]
MYELILVRYGELGLKGKNKSQFINRLVLNIKRGIKGLAPREVISTWGRIWVPVRDDLDQTIERLQQVFGIYSVSPVIKVEKNLSAIQEAALKVLHDALPQGGSFKVETRRPDKTFPMLSPEISKAVGSYLFAHSPDIYQAEMHHPEHTIQVEIRSEGAFVYGQVIPCAKGLPVGSSGRAVLMLSGGIDSPVAGWMAMKRGVTIEAVHFHSFPFTSERAKQKVIDLCQVLALWGGKIRLHVVHFTEIQKAIRQNCREEYGITIMRRMMFRLAERIAAENKAFAIYTGESVGQVASQTLESMYTINQVTNMPVLRPLVGMDKEEIIKISQSIKAFDISIRPYEDCCTIFLPDYPKIRPRLEEAIMMEEKLDVEALIREALEKTEVLEIIQEEIIS